MTTTFVDFEITKADTQADGTVIVRGPATTDDVDSDRQIIDATFAAKKLPEWLASGGNVRRMHQPDAVGGGMTLEREGSSQILTAHIIDPVAAKLASPHPVTGVRVLRAFSVGISGAKIVKDMRAGWTDRRRGVRRGQPGGPSRKRRVQGRPRLQDG